jgi:hypothetical protein
MKHREEDLWEVLVGWETCDPPLAADIKPKAAQLRQCTCTPATTFQLPAILTNEDPAHHDGLMQPPWRDSGRGWAAYGYYLPLIIMVLEKYLKRGRTREL